MPMLWKGLVTVVVFKGTGWDSLWVDRLILLLLLKGRLANVAQAGPEPQAVLLLSKGYNYRHVLLLHLHWLFFNSG